MSKDILIIKKWMKIIHDKNIEDINLKKMYKQLKRVNPELFKVYLDYQDGLFHYKYTLFVLFCNRIALRFYEVDYHKRLRKYKNMLKILVKVGATKNACNIRKDDSTLHCMSETIRMFQDRNKRMNRVINFEYERKKFLNDILEAGVKEEATLKIQRNPIMRNYIYKIREKIDDDIMKDESKKRQLYDDMMQNLNQLNARNYIYSIREKIDDDIIKDKSKKSQLDDMTQDLNPLDGMSNDISIIKKWMKILNEDSIHYINFKKMYKELKQVNPELFKIYLDYKGSKCKYTFFLLFCNYIKSNSWVMICNDPILKKYENILKFLVVIGATKNACNIRARKDDSDINCMSEVIKEFQERNREMDKTIRYEYRKKKFLNDVLEAGVKEEATLRIQRNPIMRNYIYKIREKIDDDIMKDESKKRRLYDDMMQKRIKLEKSKILNAI